MSRPRSNSFSPVKPMMGNSIDPVMENLALFLNPVVVDPTGFINSYGAVKDNKFVSFSTFELS